MRALFKRRTEGPHVRRPRLPVRDAAIPSGAPKRSRLIRPRFLLLITALLIANWVLMGLIDPPEPSVRVPYSPVFLDEVRAGNVERINSRGAGITGEFRKEVTWPREGDGEDPETATKFATQLPAFTDEQ